MGGVDAVVNLGISTLLMWLISLRNLLIAGFINCYRTSVGNCSLDLAVTDKSGASLPLISGAY
jgi:hypothetical protein